MAQGEALTHLDASGAAHVVDVGAKAETARGAIARAKVVMSAAAFVAVRDATLKKGDAVAVARIAGISAAKRTAELIPLCHPLRISSIAVDIRLDEVATSAEIMARVEAMDRTGVEMEALTAASVAALTLYDMIKAVDRAAHIEGLRVVEKWGGRTGHHRLEP